MKLIWLDDVRDPFANDGDWLVFSPIPKLDITELVWIKNYEDFINHIKDFGVPDAICFDHDLSLVQVHHGITKEILPENEKTGYDCAKWLVEYCLDNKTPLPEWKCQSANTVGRENIDSLLNNYLKHNGTIN